MRQPGRAGRRFALALLLAVGMAGALPALASSGSSLFCDGEPARDAVHQGRALRVAAFIKEALDRSGGRVALVSRSGLDLSWFGHRYSHAGLALRDSTLSPWAVRQLYFACDEQRPRVFDQGLSAFVLGVDDPGAGFVSVVLPGDEAAQALLAQAARDDRRALQVLGAAYSANAYPFSLTYQNCNQWVAELLALAWRGADEPVAESSWRALAQAWLQAQAYAPATVSLGLPPLMWLSRWWPYVHADDHPAQDLRAARYRVSLPASLEAFMRQRDPAAQRLEFCHDEQRVVLRQGWVPIGPRCEPEGQDTVLALD